MGKLALFLLVLLTALRVDASPAISRQSTWFLFPGSGEYSTAAHNVCSNAHADAIRSPNGKRKVLVSRDGGGTRLSAVTETGQAFPLAAGDWPCPEIGWSPDSSRFFITYSDGGAVGNYLVSTYHVTSEKLEETSLVSAVREDSVKRYPRCFSPEEPNIAGIAWSTDSARLLVASQVLPHSNCDEMGTFRLYEVDARSGKILQQHSQLEAKKRLYKLLGPELRAANDDCLLTPRSCQIPQLHSRQPN